MVSLVVAVWEVSTAVAGWVGGLVGVVWEDGGWLVPQGGDSRAEDPQLVVVTEGGLVSLLRCKSKPLSWPLHLLGQLPGQCLGIAVPGTQCPRGPGQTCNPLPASGSRMFQSLPAHACPDGSPSYQSDHWQAFQTHTVEGVGELPVGRGQWGSHQLRLHPCQPCPEEG